MKAAVLNGVGQDFVIEDVDIADPIGREVLIDVKACGLCHSDAHIRDHDFGFPMPTVLGHELAGVVIKVGPDVKEIAVGDHVVGCLVSFCGHCRRCAAGKPYECEHPEETRRGEGEAPRLSRNGETVTQFSELSGFAEQALVHENCVVRVTKDIPFEKACLLGCGVVTGAGAAINTAEVRVGDTVAVIGCGGVGLNAVQGARLAGAHKIIAIDLQPEKLELAKTFGATHTINPNEVDDVVAAVQEITESSGVDHAFEVIGLKPTAEQAIKILGVGGGAYQIGMIPIGKQLEIDPFVDILMQQRKYQGVYMGSTSPKRDIPLYADLYQQGRFNLDDLVSKTIRLEDINAGYAELEGGKIARSVIVFD